MNHVTEKKLNNKGFSLVELIIVIAIMAVLIGVLAPQYIKYVHSSRISSDISNAEAIATAVNVALSDPVDRAIAGASPLTVAANAAIVTDHASPANTIVSAPESKVDNSYNWVITYDENGVRTITLGGDQIYPDAGDYRTANP